MKISASFLISGLIASALAYTRGSICNDPSLANTGCQGVRTSCNLACNGQIAAGIFGCRAQCDAECDQCTQSIGGATIGTQYQTCMNAAKTCADEQKCATAKNNLFDHCESLTTDALNAPPWVSISLEPQGCGAGAVVPSCSNDCTPVGGVCGLLSLPNCCRGEICRRQKGCTVEPCGICEV